MNQIFKFCLFSLVIGMLVSCGSSRILNVPIARVNDKSPALDHQFTMQRGTPWVQQWDVCGGETWRFAIKREELNNDDPTKQILIAFSLPEANKVFYGNIDQEGIETFSIPIEQDGHLQLNVISPYRDVPVNIGWNIEYNDVTLSRSCQANSQIPSVSKDLNVNVVLKWSDAIDLDLSSSWLDYGITLDWRKPSWGRSRLARDNNTPCLAVQAGNSEILEWHLPYDEVQKNPGGLHFYVHFFSACNRNIPFAEYDLKLVIDGTTTVCIHKQDFAFDATDDFTYEQITQMPPCPDKSK